MIVFCVCACTFSPVSRIDSMSNVLSGFGQHGVPLDVYVIDMDW